MSDGDPIAEHGIDLQAVFLELVERSGMTRYRIAQETGLSESVLSGYATGRRRPTLEALCKIATAAGLRIGISVNKSPRG